MFMLSEQVAIAVAATLGVALSASLAVPALAGPLQSKSYRRILVTGGVRRQRFEFAI